MQHGSNNWRDKTPDELARSIAGACAVLFVGVVAGALILATVQNAALAAWSLASPVVEVRRGK